MNTSNKSLHILTIYFISISFIGLFIIALLIFNVRTSELNYPWQKPFIFLIFMLICFLGIMAGTIPSKCLIMISPLKKIQNNSSNEEKIEMVREKPIEIEGHHPDCGKFSGHVFQLRGKNYCAGCTGLVLGAIISVLGSFVYLLDGSFLGEIGTLIFCLGIIGVLSGLFANIWLNVRWSFVQLFLNFFFAVGAFFILVGIDKITGNFFVELYFLALVFILILTRITISQRKHEIICETCGIEACNLI